MALAAVQSTKPRALDVGPYTMLAVLEQADRVGFPNDIPVIVLEGYIDQDSVPKIQGQLRQPLLIKPPKNMIIDLRQAETLDDTGVLLMLGLLKRCADLGGHCYLSLPEDATIDGAKEEPQPVKVLRIMGMLPLFGRYDPDLEQLIDPGSTIPNA